MTSTLDTIGGWLHLNAGLKFRHHRLFHVGYQTEFNGPGRVLQLAFFGGAGYVIWNKARTGYLARGFTINLRLRKAAWPSSLVTLQGAARYPLVGVTTNPSRWYF